MLRLCSEIKKLIRENVIIVFSHSASDSGGAPVVLYELVKELSKNKTVIFLSKRNGELINICRNERILSYVYGYNPQLFFKIINKSAKIKLSIVNTVVCGNCLSFMQKNTDFKIVWWLHENEEIYGIMKKQLPPASAIGPNVDVKCVSESAKKAFNKYFPNIRCSLMFYGVPDLYKFAEVDIEKAKLNCNKDKWVLLSIGQITGRKNQLRLLESWRLFCKNHGIENVELRIVGKIENEAYANMFFEELQRTPKVKYIEYVPRTEIRKLYIQADAFISVSKSDPLPVVITEAFMYKIPCIISDGNGQYAMVENGVNAFKCLSDDPTSISNAIKEAYCCGESVGNAGRYIYEKYFSISRMADSLVSDYID